MAAQRPWLVPIYLPLNRKEKQCIPLLVIRNGEIRTEGYWKITVPGTVVLVSGQRLMFLSSNNTRDGFWLVLGEQTQLTVEELSVDSLLSI